MKGWSLTTQEIRQGDAVDLVHELPDGINCIITDPPYGIAYWSRQAQTPTGRKYARSHEGISGDATVEGALALFVDVMKPLVAKTADECEMYVFTRWDILDLWVDACRSFDEFKYKMLLVWDKGMLGQGDIDGSWGCGHELIMYFKKGRRDINFKRSAVMYYENVSANQKIHPMEKPVALLEELIKVSTNPGDLIVDPFSGSGSTIVAAQRTGRSAIGLERDEDYVRMSRLRLAEAPMF